VGEEREKFSLQAARTEPDGPTSKPAMSEQMNRRKVIDEKD